MKRRKLFPPPNGANGTDCDSDLCDPSFDPYSFYYSQPPPPPLPLPSPLAIPDDQAHGVSVSPSIIVLITLLASFSLLTGYYVVVSKSCFGLCKRRNNQNYSQSGGEDEDEEDDDDDQLDHQNNRAVDHPIWFITTVGLQQAIINSITVVKYKRNEGLIEGTECSVCLNEFREDETLRLLPKCSHAFHIPCIDTWLRSHTNCPLCRANIVNDFNTNRRSTNIVGSNSGNQSGGDDTDQETPMGNSEIGTTGQRVDQDLNNSNGSCVLERRNDDDNCEEMLRNKVRLVRSVSMDSSSSSLGILNYKIREMENHNVFGRSNGREVGQSKQCLRIRPVAMKRSLSCRGRFLSSRQNQRLNSILLPL